MKDQYFGDFGDYQKVSLFKILRDQGLRVLVYWMKTPDDGSSDGKHVTYLEKPELWRSFAPDIYDFLKEKIGTGERLLTHIEESTYGSGIGFLNQSIEDSEERAGALKRVIESEADIVLFDPDNGIEVVSTNKRNIHKYVTWDEITRAFQSDKSVIIYQHFSRSNREDFIRGKMAEIHKRVTGEIRSVQVRHSVYFFLIQESHGESLGKVIADFANIWKNLAIAR